MSPPSRRRLLRQTSNNTPSTCSSRNESPRFTKEQEYGVIKMRKSSAARLNPNRNSASIQTSTLQEDLIKLIGQDFEHAGKTLNAKLKVKICLLGNKEDSLIVCSNFQDQKIRTPQHPVRRSKSRETLISHNADETNEANYMARPATVISNTSGSSGNSNNL